MKNISQMKSQSHLSKLADILMIPIMYLVSGSIETPQRTHFWNNIQLNKSQIENFDPGKMVQYGATADAVKKGMVLFHIPIFGGWKDYVVIEPENFNGSWHVGWVTEGYAGISQIEIKGHVRMLLGDNDVSFFGMSSLDNTQIKIQKISEGKIGDGGQYKKVPLL